MWKMKQNVGKVQALISLLAFPKQHHMFLYTLSSFSSQNFHRLKGTILPQNVLYKHNGLAHSVSSFTRFIAK